MVVVDFESLMCFKTLADKDSKHMLAPITDTLNSS